MGTIKTYYGCANIRGPLEGYGKRFDVLELDVLDRTPETKAATLKKWRKEAGPRLAFSLVAPKAVAAVRPTPALDEGLARLLEAQRILHARFILLATPVEVTPAALPRERLGKVVERLREGLGEARSVVRIAWMPRGVWELDQAARFADRLGIDLATDPMADPREPFWDASLRYVRLSAVGGRTAFPATRMRAVAELLVASQRDVEEAGDVSFERAVVLTTPRATTDAKKMRQLVKQLSGRGKRVLGGRVVSPRGRARTIDEGEEE
jgi:uncharacterized protein YecE (DUF72 family)